MAEIFGAVAAGIALCSQLTTIAVAIRKATKEVKNARKDIAKLSDETVIFANLCEGFLNVCADDPTTKRGGAFSIGPLYLWIKRTIVEQGRLLRKVEALIPDDEYRYSFRETLVAHREWFFNKSKVKSLRTSLTIARESMNGFTNLMYIRKLNEELQYLKTALRDASLRQSIEERFKTTLETKIRSVENAIMITNAAHSTSKRKLRTAKRDISKRQNMDGDTNLVPAQNELFEFMESLNVRAKEYLSPTRSNQGTSPSLRSTSAPVSDSVPTSPIGSYPRDSQPRSSPNRAPRFRASRIPTSYATLSSASARTIPNTPTPTSISPVSSMSELTSAPTHSIILEPAEGQPCKTSTPSIADESLDTMHRGHMNDVERSMLSETKVKPLAVKVQQIGRHTIRLDATSFYINKHAMSNPTYAVGDAFFQTLLRHKDKIDTLVKIRDAQDEGQNITWDGIPGWRVHPGGITRLISNLSIPDI